MVTIYALFPAANTRGEKITQLEITTYRDVYYVAHAVNVHHASLLGIACEILQVQMPLDLLVPVLK